VVTRVYTDLAVLDITPTGFRAIAVASGVTADELVASTDAPVDIAVTA
jgi:acyl CoA:acetate/3-ketoacid CoA transferase beta subunit